MTIENRAIQDDQKEERRKQIMDGALSLFQDQEYEEIKMIDISRQAKMAKGTVYLYFKTKESLFLSIMQECFQQWFKGFHLLLNHQQLDKPSFVQAVVSSLHSSPHFGRLIMIQHSILEKNLDYNTARDFKLRLAEMLRLGASDLEQHLDFVAAGQGQLLLLQVYALIIGLKQLTEPNAFIKEIIEQEKINSFNIEFDEIFFHSLLQYLNGLESTNKE